MKSYAMALVTILMIMATGCQKPEPIPETDVAATSRVSGSISYRERMALTNEAVVEVNENAPNNEDRIDKATGSEIEGMFRYMADAALFRDCRDNRVYPVAMEAQYIELERAYLNSGIVGGKEAYVQLKGRYLERPSMEGNISKVKLIVDIFNTISSNETCSPETHADLQNTYWRLLELDSNSVKSPEGSREIHLILATADSRAHGFAGCNNFFGNYELGEDALSFSPLGSTMMACPEGMDIEQSFLQALGATTRAKISGQIMSLYAGEQLLARFEAVYL